MLLKLQIGYDNPSFDILIKLKKINKPIANC